MKELNHEILLICEGSADRNFFEKFLGSRSSIPPFEIPFPERRGELSEPGKQEPLGGSSSFPEMIKAVRSDARFYENLKGILVIADSRDDPSKTFDEVVKYVMKAGGFNAPEKPLEPSSPESSNPPFSVMLVPGEDEPGGLETILIKELLSGVPWIQKCLDDYLSCGEINVLNWSAEKQDKARFQCLVAALNRDDPNKSISTVFSASSPIIDIKSNIFDSIEDRITKFCESVGVI